MSEPGIFKGGIILVQNNQHIKVSNRGIIDPDQINFTKSHVTISGLCLSKLKFVIFVITLRIHTGKSPFLVTGPTGLVIRRRCIHIIYDRPVCVII